MMPWGDKKKAVTIILGEMGMAPASLNEGSEGEYPSLNNPENIDFALESLSKQIIAAIESKSTPLLKQCLKTLLSMEID